MGNTKAVINEIGNVYGHLIVISRGENYSIKKSDGRYSIVATWICKCSCGKTTQVRGRDLRNGKTKSCGHTHKFLQGEAAFNSFYRKCVESAMIRGHEWNLSKEQVKEITSQNCYYCGKEPSQSTKTSKGKYIYNGIDRLDNSKGYIFENVVPCCKDCNYAKRTMSIDKFKSWITSVYKHFVMLKSSQ